MVAFNEKCRKKTLLAKRGQSLKKELWCPLKSATICHWLSGVCHLACFFEETGVAEMKVLGQCDFRCVRINVDFFQELLPTQG